MADGVPKDRLSPFCLVLPVLIVVPMPFSPSRHPPFPPRGFSLRRYANCSGDPKRVGATVASVREPGDAAPWGHRHPGRLGTIPGLVIAHSLPAPPMDVINVSATLKGLDRADPAGRDVGGDSAREKPRRRGLHLPGCGSVLLLPARALLGREATARGLERGGVAPRSGP